MLRSPSISGSIRPSPRRRRAARRPASPFTSWRMLRSRKSIWCSEIRGRKRNGPTLPAIGPSRSPPEVRSIGLDADADDLADRILPTLRAHGAAAFDPVRHDRLLDHGLRRREIGGRGLGPGHLAREVVLARA